MANARIDSALGKHGYTQIKKVGEGSFGAAILAQHNNEKERDTKAVVKMIDISRASKQEREDALKESQVLSSLKHPYIVRYRESFHEDGWLCIVMDYCEGGDLSDRVKKMRQSGKSFSQEQVLRWFTQAVLALKYIHEMHILHRDLKSGNFFLSRSGNLKMGDFGIAKVLECTAACAQTQIGTPYYLSPEICQGKPYGWGSDIWSMGCILYEMCARRVPFDAPDLKSLIQKITRGPAPELPSEYSTGMRNLCKDLLDRDASKRPCAADILKRPVVQEVVRKMLDEVKGDDAEPKGGGGGDDSAKASAPAPAKKEGSGTHSSAAGSYQRNDNVEFYSVTHGEWLPAQVTNVQDDGKIMLNVKPNVWLSKEVQAEKVRPRQNGTGGGGGGSSGGGAQRPPQQPGSGHSAASPGPGGRASGGALARNSSRDGLGGGRNPTPGRDSGVRAASPRAQPAGQRAPSSDRRQRTPQPQRPGGS